METALAEKIVRFSAAEVRQMSEEIRRDLLAQYDKFFQDIMWDVIGATKTPYVISQGGASWEPLKEKWSFQKRKLGQHSTGQEHYQGLSGASTMLNPLGRSRKGGKDIGMSRTRAASVKPKGKVKVGAFEDYIRKLAHPGTTARFFGDIVASYNVVSPDPRFRIEMKQSDGTITNVKARNTYSGKFAPIPSELRFTAKIEAFGKLNGLAFDEKNIVDYIIKRADPANEKQWVKINSEVGIGRSRRPIRAIITPMLRYYIQRRFPSVVRDAIQARSK